MIPADQLVRSPWPHRWAVALACATFPLVWIGGLVTTTGSGMAVPDWPNTYGYNLFLYPWREWITGPWALFLEHSHRLVGASVGLVSIGLLIALWRTEDRRWMRAMGFVVLALVMFQGALGGIRVLRDSREFAMFHGCTGPLFFGLTVSMAVFTSRAWRGRPSTSSSSPAAEGFLQNIIRPLTAVTAVLIYLQIVVGAVLRHMPVGAEPSTFALAVRFHLFLAAIVLLHVAMLVWLVRRRSPHVRPIRRLASFLGVLVIVQLALGAGTWFVKYSVPAWASEWISGPSTPIEAGGWLQTHLVTAHVAVGSLMLGTSVALALYVQRLLSSVSTAGAIRSTRLGAAV